MSNVRVKSTGGYVRIGEVLTPQEHEVNQYNLNLSLLSRARSTEEREKLLDKVNKYEAMYM